MKNFTKTINGIKYKGQMFEKLDIINKFNQSEEKWELIDQYQKIFPELLLKDTNDFIINGRILWEQLGEPHTQFNKWIERKLVRSEVLMEIRIISQWTKKSNEQLEAVLLKNIS